MTKIYPHQCAGNGCRANAFESIEDWMAIGSQLGDASVDNMASGSAGEVSARIRNCQALVKDVQTLQWSSESLPVIEVQTIVALPPAPGLSREGQSIQFHPEEELVRIMT